MQHSVAEYFSHSDTALLIFSVVMGFVACGGAMVMLGFERHTDDSRKESTRAMAGACLGGGVWAAYFLIFLALQPAVLIGFNFSLLIASGALAIASSAFVLSRYGPNSPKPWRHSAVAATLLALAFAAMHGFIAFAIETTAHVHWLWKRACVTFVFTVIGLTCGLYLARFGPGPKTRFCGGLTMFANVMGFCIGAATSVELVRDANLPVAGDSIAPLVLAFMVCVIAVGLLVSAMAYALVDRSYVVARLTAESMASKLADAALEGLIVHDGNSVIEANARFSWLASDGTESVRGQPLSDFFDDEALASIRQTMAEGGEGVFETSLQGADTEVEICTRLYDREQSQYVTAVRDLSMRKRIDSAERANLAKSQFLANMSHELRTPLNAIIGYSEMIIEDSDDKGAIRDASEINVAAKNMLSLVNDIVDLSRIEDGKIDFCFDLCEFTEMADRLAKRFTGVAHNQGLTLKIEVDESAPYAVIDEKRIEQCVSQILSNAIKFTEKGGVAVRFYTEDGDFKAMVCDTGIGMPPARVSQLFEAFSQGDGSISRRYGGVGVGLALTSRLIALMGGGLEIETAEGQGSTFTLIAPSDPDPDILALRRKSGARVIKVIDSARDKAA